ncbi:MAG: porin family protein [Bacteroidota bacterium]
MKINYIILSLILLTTSNIFGQKKSNFGLNAGLTYSSIYGFDKSYIPHERSLAMGYLVGITFEYEINEDISIITNLNYEKKIIGHKLVSNDEGEGLKPDVVKMTMNYNYITLPILLKYDFSSNFYINAGPYVGYLINRIDKGGGYSEDTSEFTEKMDFGLTTSIGYLILLDKNKISFELRNNLGLINTSSYPVIDNGTNKNHSIGIVAGFLF